MDHFDRTILATLQSDARISYRRLGARAHLSPNATAERVRRLEQTGVIRGYATLMDLPALGLRLEAFVDVKLEQTSTMRSFESELRKLKLVREAVVMTGAWDCRLRVACPDPAGLGSFIETLRAIPGVRETSSTVICGHLRVADVPLES